MFCSDIAQSKDTNEATGQSLKASDGGAASRRPKGLKVLSETSEIKPPAPFGKKVWKELSLKSIAKPICPEVTNCPATPAVTVAVAPWRPRCARKAAPPPLTRMIVFTPTNQKFESLHEYVTVTQERRKQFTQACFSASKNMDCRDGNSSLSPKSRSTTPRNDARRGSTQGNPVLRPSLWSSNDSGAGLLQQPTESAPEPVNETTSETMMISGAEDAKACGQHEFGNRLIHGCVDKAAA